jgi:hypothetical protein
LSSVTIHASQEQVGVLIIVITITTIIILIIHGPVHHCWLSCSQNHFHSLPSNFVVLFVTLSSSIFISHLHCPSTSCLFPQTLLFYL